MLELGPFLTLLGALWVTFIPITAQMKTLNDTRDKILASDSKYTLEHRRLFFRNDWIPLLVGAVFQQIVLTVVLFWLPWAIPTRPEVQDKVSLVCFSLALFAILRLVGFVVTFRTDYRLLSRSTLATQ